MVSELGFVDKLSPGFAEPNRLKAIDRIVRYHGVEGGEVS
jgi:hypothetical protein